MAALELGGSTLGQKHCQYNKLLHEAIENRRIVKVEDFIADNSDIHNLLNVDIASHTKNVDYFLKVLTCDDLLYISKAIKKSNWLINDESYAHIINPNYLYTNIFPQMCSKAITKFIKHLRNNLNDEKRAEEFYAYEQNPEEAVKWLHSCSITFVEENIVNHVQHIKITTLKRLCEKSIKVLEIYMKDDAAREKGKVLQATMFLLQSDTDKYLDLVETVPSYYFPTFSKTATTILMKNCSNRIIDKFYMYNNRIHIPTFIRCLEAKNIKDFLIKLASKPVGYRYEQINLKRLLTFINSMPQDIRFEFVKQVFIDKKHESKEHSAFSEMEIKAMRTLCAITCAYPFYNFIWYQFAPFDIAFEKIKELLGNTEAKNDQKIAMLNVLITSTQYNIVNERIFLEYIRDKLGNTAYVVKEQAIKILLSRRTFLKYDCSTWMVLDDIFKTMDIYSESVDPDTSLVEAIVLYKNFHKEEVPGIVEKKFSFNSLIPYHKKLTEKQKEILFMYLYNLITAKLATFNTTTEKEFAEKVKTLEQVLKLLRDFKIELKQYPDLILLIKDLIQIRNNSSWTTSMETIFNIQKTWRKLFFEESLILYPTESSLLNALKHGPYILDHNKTVVSRMLCNNKMSLRHVLGKIKIYWSNSIAENMKATYIGKLNVLGDHKTTARGLSILLAKRNLRELLEKYAPKQAKINWSEIDEVELSIQQQLAKNMHNARPQPHPECILWYAKGDYLQYALPSLLAMFYNLNGVSSRKYIPTLLAAPVSLQKHGIRLAVSKMEIEELLSYFDDIWKNNLNASIRSVMFKNVFDSLCKGKDPKKNLTTWGLLKMFINNLTFQEDKAIYKLLFKVQKVPFDIRGDFYMICYNFLRKLINTGNEYEDFKNYFYTMYTEYSVQIIEQLHSDFVDAVILEFIDKQFIMNDVCLSLRCNLKLISSYLLVAPNEKTQLERYENVLQPILRQSFDKWNTLKLNDSKYFARNILTTLLDCLRCDVKNYVGDKKKIVPEKIFSLIQNELENSLTTPENYMLLTKWKLTASFIAILARHQPIDNWEETCLNIAVEFGNVCNNFLWEDCNKHFSRIYLLFEKALESMLDNFVPEIVYWDIFRGFMQNMDLKEGYLMVIKLFPQSRYLDEELKEKLAELRKKVLEHPSSEIKIHFYEKFKVYA